MIKRHIAFKTAVAFFLFGLCAWPAAAQDDPTRRIEAIRPAVVALVAYDDKGEVIEWGNGFFISRDGRLLTSRHLLKGASRAEVHTREGEVYPVSMVIAEDSALDLIQLLVDLKDCEAPYLRMSDVSAARGDLVTVIGHQHIVQGLVSYIRTISEPGKNFLFSASSTARATGGPVVNKKGEVIAIATRQAVGDQTVTLAIASSGALALVPSRTDTLADWNARIEGEPPVPTEVLFFTGLNLTMHLEYKKAIPLLEEAAQRNPRDAEARFYTGYARARLNRYEEALLDYQEAIRIAPDYAEALNNIGTVYDKLGRFEEAVDVYSRAIKLKPDFGLAYNNLGAAYYRLGRYEKAIDACKRALQLLDRSSTAHNNLGMAYFKLGRHQEAVESLRKAVDLNPNSADAHNNLGTTYYKEGRSQEAIESFKKAVELRPDFADAVGNLGATYLLLGRFEEAIEAFERATRIKPDFAAAYNCAGFAHAKSNRFQEAVRLYKEAIRVSPGFAEAHYNLAVSHLVLGDGQAAFAEYGALKRLNQNLATQLFSIMKGKYTVDAAAGTRAEGRYALSQAPQSHSAIERIIEMINRLVAKKALDRGVADGLIAKLQIAYEQPVTSNEIIKINLLNGFIENVSDLINSQEIPAEEGQALIDEANKIINHLSALPPKNRAVVTISSRVIDS